MTGFKYATLFREPGLGTVPRSGLRECSYEAGTAPSGHHYFGTAVYDRELTDQEIDAYELEFIEEVEA